MKERTYYVLVLAASFVAMLSVIVPHHHHADGSPCYEWLWHGAASDAHGHSSGGDDGHAADCTHNQALKPAVEKNMAGGDMHLGPLLVFSFVCFPLWYGSDRPCSLSGQGQTAYRETLHASWIPPGRRTPCPSPDRVMPRADAPANLSCWNLPDGLVSGKCLSPETEKMRCPATACGNAGPY